ncbi:MAG TPA: hypothetical protein VKI62_04795 [Bacteroidota bacterium]|nr:hypothetical protein [Bacteroidota bacterium]
MRRNAAAAGIRTVIFIFLGMIGPVSLNAQALIDSVQSQPWYESISINGFVSTAYSYNFNRPDSMKNEYRVFDVNDNSFRPRILREAFNVIFQKDLLFQNLRKEGFKNRKSIPCNNPSSLLAIGDTTNRNLNKIL